MYLVDLICHGVPSFDLLKRHIKNVLPNKQVSKLSFRDGNELKLSIVATDNTLYCKSTVVDRFKEFYYDTFIDGCTFRESCYTCLYAKPNRCSDITIGDFWGLQKDADEYLPNHTIGTSVLLPVSEKGKCLIQATSQRFNLVERTVNEAVKGNHQLRQPSYKGWRTKVFRCLAKFIRIQTAYKITVFDRIVRHSLSKLTKR